ncbi:MAG: Maltodextrin phosphorylase [Syntrophorhabdus sp. PtaU1.Bin153]|nr:MAG: Maltodextrin phosphorylase [Syntrophorhabdus sp. PtaU1.Bin153]
MGDQARIAFPICAFLPTDIEGADSLVELALDMRWSWNHAADEIWKQLDPALWELTYNPLVVLETVSRDRVRATLADPAVRRKLDDLVKIKRSAAEEPGWFQQTCAGSSLTSVAYFSMEFMLSEALPIYSGGLGNVAGDQLKAASDLGVPVIGVGLLYQQGYFRQVIDRDGRQQALFPYNDPGQLPITAVHDQNGEWLRLEVPLPGYPVWVRVWQVQVGRVTLYLLDSNDPANFPAHRGIASELYGGGAEVRLKQEILLGLAGWRVLEALNIKPEVCHLNEGHAAFAVLERARCFMVESGQPFDVALAVTRAGNLFTTHTPVAAGFDRFSPLLMEQYFGAYARDMLGVSLHDLLALGRRDPNDLSESFNMAYLAVRGSGAVNGVSRLHGKISRRIFQPLFPRWPEQGVPVGYVTNGVHVPTWSSEEADVLWTEVCGDERWLGTLENMEKDMRSVPDSVIWECRASARKNLVGFVRERLSRQLALSGVSQKEVDTAKLTLGGSVLTLGFARRFAAYKRPNLLLHDPDRLLRILANPERPAQLIVAGKAHPDDQAGQDMIRQWIEFLQRPEAQGRVVFLGDYDMLLTANLVQGVDVWINTPRRPWEACGTSGMKVLVNGGINLSELDGWWAEAYDTGVGWAIGDGQEHGDDPVWDGKDANALYALLEEEVIPQFYTRDDQGIPSGWVARIRESMARLTPVFSANRAVREYTERYYLPAAEAFRNRVANNGEAGVMLVNWKRRMERTWGGLRFGPVKAETRDGRHVFEAQIYLGEVNPNHVRVELYADGIDDGSYLRLEAERAGRLVGEQGFTYVVAAPATRPVTDYTLRIVPTHPGAAIPLETTNILWLR